MMKKLKLSVLFGLMFLLMAALPVRTVHAHSLFTTEKSQNLLDKKRPVPFKATINATILISGDLPTFEATVSGSGNASHLGIIGFHTEETLIFDMTMQGNADQDIVLTAPNGDQLHIHANSNLSPVSAVPLIFDEEGTGTITGGTGRFEYASGSIGLKALVNTDTWVAQISINGTIMY